jgi:hypothetical protein
MARLLFNQLDPVVQGGHLSFRPVWVLPPLQAGGAWPSLLCTTGLLRQGLDLALHYFGGGDPAMVPTESLSVLGSCFPCSELQPLLTCFSFFFCTEGFKIFLFLNLNFYRLFIS